MRLPLLKILAQAKADYEKAWLDSKSYLQMEGNLFNLKPMGKAHPLNDVMEIARQSLIKLGFEELVLPMFVEEQEVYKEYGPEAALILDRLYYLAELPRPDIGVSQQKLEHIKKIVADFEKIKELQSIFRRYKKGEVEADDIIEVMVQELQIEESQATEIIDKVFPEFKNLQPVATKQTLRSHTTALWFLVLEQMVKKKPLPLQYFLVGPKFRREQKQDATHLYVSNTISIALAAEEISLEDGKRIGKQIALSLGFGEVDVRTKTATSKYYAPQTEFEIFVQHPITKQWIEIGDGGFYSPVSLAKYNIDVPVLNIGFGCERITMIRTQETDIRRLVYPYFYEELSFTDQELANYLFYKEKPKTKEGITAVELVEKNTREKKDQKSPIEIEVWGGTLNGRKVKITLFENEPNANLIGKAALNELWIKEGKIISLTPGNSVEGGVKTGLTYIRGVLNQIVSIAEELSSMDPSLGSQQQEFRVKMVKRPGEINIDMDELIRDFITARNKKMDVKGPVFIGAKISVD